MSSLEPVDPLAHRALQALVQAETSVRRALASDLERAGVSTAGFSALVVVAGAGGTVQLRELREQLGWSKANATEVTLTLEERGLVERNRLERDRRAVALVLRPAGRRLVERLFPGHCDRVTTAFAPLDDEEKRSLADLCARLAA